MSVRLKVKKEDGSHDELEEQWDEKLSGFSIYTSDATEIDISPISFHTALRALRLVGPNLKSIDLTPLASCTRLQEIHISDNQLQSIDLSPLAFCSNLQELHLGSNQLQSINLAPLRSCSHLILFYLCYSPLQTIDLSPLASCTNLQILELRGNQLQHIDLGPLASCTNLQRLDLSTNQLQTIHLAPLISLQTLHLGKNQLQSIDLSPLVHCSNLQKLDLNNNQLQTIDLTPLSPCIQLNVLFLKENQLERIDFSPLASCRLGRLFLDNNKLEVLDITPLLITPNFELLSYKQWERVYVSSWIRDPFDTRTVVRTNYEYTEDYEVDQGEYVELGYAVEPPAREGSWELLHMIASIPHSMSIPVQSYVLQALGLAKYGFIDADISEFLCSIPPTTSIGDARNRVRPFVIEKICEQIDRGGTTIGLDVEACMDSHEISRRIPMILELRDTEMKKVNSLYSLLLTAYGFSIADSLEMAPLEEFIEETRETGVAYNVIDFWDRVREAVIKAGFDVSGIEKYNHERDRVEKPEKMSIQMRNYVYDRIEAKSNRNLLVDV